MDLLDSFSNKKIDIKNSNTNELQFTLLGIVPSGHPIKLERYYLLNWYRLKK